MHNRRAGEPAQASKDSGKKIDKAFEIMDSIEETGDAGPGDAAAPRGNTRHGGADRQTSSSQRHGIRFRFSLDAVMPEKKESDGEHDPTQKNQSALVDIGLTLPFIWKIPIIGGIAQKVARHIKPIKF